MTKITVGNFKIEISDPHPCWIKLSHERDWHQEIKMHHKELSDLRYAIDKAISETRLKLKDDRDEVMP